MLKQVLLKVAADIALTLTMCWVAGVNFVTVLRDPFAENATVMTAWSVFLLVAAIRQWTKD